MYFGEMLRRSIPDSNWMLCTRIGEKGIKDVDYGHVVIGGLGDLQVNPYRLIFMASLRMSEGRARPGELVEIYDIWKAKPWRIAR